jgi:hypothetical protein
LSEIQRKERLVALIQMAVHVSKAPPIFTAPPPPTRKKYTGRVPKRSWLA